MSVWCRWCGTREFIFQHEPGASKPVRAKSSFKRHEDTSLTIGRTKFIDSINYMLMRLSELPKTFGLEDTPDKGIFLHLFNTVENQTYVRPLPAVHYYSPGNMRSKERERFLAWHAEMTQKNVVFDFQREIRYCRTDVDILRRACIAFRKIFINRSNVCSFEECTTIASTCMTVFRKNFLHEKEIGIIPPGGYRKTFNYSRKALQWLVWMECELGHPINHAGRAREYCTVDSTLVDGYFEATSGFPIGHPDIYVGAECSALIGMGPYYNFDSLEGFIRCTTDCTHDRPSEREFTGTWISCELRKAIEKGYFVTSQEANGWSSECENDNAAKERYLREYKETENIVFNKSNIGIPIYERLDRRVLYYNMDSCIYVSTGEPDEYEPRTGNFLEDMTDELESHGRSSYIEAFVSGGPKFYAYVVRTPEGRIHEICKVKAQFGELRFTRS
ncbi:uncharacterized protein [Anoplolepis gracilipes]|uniref:uncharacterized protein n=1 Tax=Anoplolepis gracilipes TaxID=354296 RepID=UPI003BA16B1F